MFLDKFKWEIKEKSDDNSLKKDFKKISKDFAKTMKDLGINTRESEAYAKMGSLGVTPGHMKNYQDSVRRIEEQEKIYFDSIKD